MPFEVVANILEFGRAAINNAGGAKVVQPQAFMRRAPEQSGKEAFRKIQSVIISRLKRV